MAKKYPHSLVHGVGVLLVLEALAPSPKSGSEVQDFIVGRSGNRLGLTKGAVSYTRSKLEQQGFIEHIGTTHDGREIISQLTPDGRRELLRLRKNWKEFVLTVSKIAKK